MIKKVKHSLFLFLLFAVVFCNAQISNGYFLKSKGGDKYFVALGYGQGSAHWNSNFESTEFYDKDGSVINRGDFHFGANSPTKNFDINVLAPIKHIRLGLGIDFEYHYLMQLKVYTKDGSDYLLFDEAMRFDKIYLTSEVPFKYGSRKKYSFNWNFRCGWFGYTNVKRFNFIGEKPFPIAVLANTGLTADYEFLPHIYVYLSPQLEYKIYDNSRTEAPVQIIHRVFSGAVVGGFRVDLGGIAH